ncbi:U-box domain-containing protein 21-like [Andrographis paniculata]|uniref:U-box domain-containing protein 21-like n=1 Tax=Andrographis paniculata TaxID=175694 RepID=UPI0021E8FE25|nr:U-box domain-containing protein 21-like [Andrographis paniculata]
MTWSWRNRRAARRTAAEKSGELELELIIPEQFLCPISHELMKDPVTLSTGMTYDRSNIETWIDAGNSTCPVTNQLLPNPDSSIPNHAIRKMIQHWCVQNTCRGIERIPTPKIPITSHQLSQTLSQIEAAARRNDDQKCKEFVAKITSWARESDRNRRCIAANGTAAVLSKAFDSFACRNDGYAIKDGDILQELLSGLMATIPFHDEATNRNLSSTPSLEKLVSIMKAGSLSSRRNAVIAVKSILSFDENKAEEITKIEGALETLVKMIKEPICPTTTKASLLAMYHTLKSPQSAAIAARLAETGLVAALLEILAESSGRSVCEKALGVLDGLCMHGEGRLKAYENALTVAVLVKKLLRVSEVATELAISILVKLGRHDEDGETCVNVMIEALEVGAFQKLLLLLQLGTSDVTREKLSELLRLLNLYRPNVECTDSLDFKHLKRSF